MLSRNESPMKTLATRLFMPLVVALLSLTASATSTITLADFNNLPTTYGALSNANYTFTTNAASGAAGFTLSAQNSDVTLGSSYVNASYGNCLSLTTSDTESHTLTLSAPEGYAIVGYSIGASANTANNKHTLTAADGTSTKFTSLGYSSYQFQHLNVSGLFTKQTTFTIQTENGGNTLYVAYFSITVMRLATELTSGTYYRLHNAAYANTAMRETLGRLTTEAPNNATYSQLWKVTATAGGGYSLQNAATGKYVQPATETSQQFTTSSAAATFYSGTRTSGGLTQFWFSSVANELTNNGERALHCASSRSYNVVSWVAKDSDPSHWYLEPAEPDEAVIAALQSQPALTSGYYRLTNASYTSRSMAESGGSVTTPTTVDNYAQLWYLAMGDGTCTLRNALTDNYIQSNPGRSVTYQTGASAYTFNLLTKESGGQMIYSFQDPAATWYGLHSAATQNYNVVGWDYAVDPSWWTITPAAVDDDELAALKASLYTDYTSQLATFFTDPACTTLKAAYSSMSDSELRSAMSALPSALQDMAVSVKNNVWNTTKDATYNDYEKSFRIHAYDIFSNSDLWDDITKTGPFAHLFHPTGIQANSGDIVYLFVSADVKDSDASLQVECVAGTDRKGAAFTLQEGYNAIYVPTDCELFVSYLLNNTAKSCNDYPDITVHIEGGTCNGCFDMRGHGHKNSDWEWLKTNMFSRTYLHVKGNSTILNCLRERVVDSDNEQNVEGIMNIFDFVFDTEERLCGNDQWAADGRYKMMVNNFDNEAGGNPYWSNGNYGYSQPGIWYNGIFNYDNLSQVGTNGGNIWVIAHELGHGHQTPINLSGTTEASNNSLAQAVSLLAKDYVGTNLFQSTRSSRGVGVRLMTERFNQAGGYSWIDYAGQRSDKAYGGSDDIWASNRFLYQLWLYFDYMGNYQPSGPGSNTGFSFMRALYDALRADPIQKSATQASPKLMTDDYLKLALKTAEITQTDLSEFFEAWGFWKLQPVVSSTDVNKNLPDKDKISDDVASSTWAFPDYTTTYIQTSAEQVSDAKAAMKAYPTKGGNIMFVEDRATGSPLPTYNNADASTFGETGYYETFGNKVTQPYSMSVDGTTVTLSGGSGAVGFKVYDESGNLVAIANTTTFTVTSEVADGLTAGTYSLVAAQGDGTDVAMGEVMLTLNDAKSAGGNTYAYGTAYYTTGLTLPAGTTAYYLTSDYQEKDGKAYITPVELGSEVPASTPVLLIGAAGTGTIRATTADVGGTNPTGNILAGTTDAEASTGTSHLVLNKNSEGYIGFYNLRAGRSVAAHRAYIPYGAVSAKSLIIQWDETDAIAPLKAETDTRRRIYDLSGRPVGQPAKGIYIQNGKKLIIK